MTSKKAPSDNTGRRISFCIAWTITAMMVVWSIYYSLDMSNRLYKRRQVLIDLVGATQENNEHRNAVIRFLREVVKENDLKVPLDENGNETWPPDAKVIVIVVPER